MCRYGGVVGRGHPFVGSSRVGCSERLLEPGTLLRGEWYRVVMTRRHRTLGFPDFLLCYHWTFASLTTSACFCFTLAVWHLPRGLTSMRIAPLQGLVPCGLSTLRLRGLFSRPAMVSCGRGRRLLTCALAPCVNYV